jgi:hypothetical protein
VGLVLTVGLAGVASAAEAGAAPAGTVVPTEVTIRKDPPVDSWPGPPLTAGTTDLSTTFHGTIAAGRPACRTGRTFKLGKIETGDEFVWLEKSRAASGSWSGGLAGEPEEALQIAVEIPAKVVVEGGTSYECGAALSASIPFDPAEFTACVLARAEERGYPLALRRTRQYIRQARAEGDEAEVALWTERLRYVRGMRAEIEQAVERRC